MFHLAFTLLTAIGSAFFGGLLTYFFLNRENRSLKYQLTEQRDKLAAASKMAALGEMAVGIGHEVNNPLSIVCANAEILLLKYRSGAQIDPAFTLKIVERVHATSEKIAQIVRGLRSFARDTSQDPLEAVEATKIVRDAIELCQNRFRMNGVELRINEGSEPLVLACRGIQVSQVLLNLLNNSFDAIEKSDEKWIEISIDAADENVRFQVRDSGKGIADDLSPNIMKPFFTTKPPGKGTGLGLSISKSIVEGHGGKLYLDPNDSHTCFVMTFPKGQLTPNSAAA